MTSTPTETTVRAMNASTVWPTLATYGANHTSALLIAAASAVAVFVILLLVARKRGTIRRWLVAASFAMSLAINAEGMWVVATQKLKLPAVFAGGVFSVFETILLTEMALASDQYRRTTIRDADGNIVKAGHPGKHGRAVFVIAVMSGVIVAFNAKSVVELALRMWLPIAVTMLWWNVLTAEGTGRPASRLAWTPTRVAERLGLLVPDVSDDLAALARERKVRGLVNVGQRVDGKVWPQPWHLWRLSRLARTADDAMVAEARARLDRVIGIVALLRPPVASQPAMVAPSMAAPVPAALTAPPVANAIASDPVTMTTRQPVTDVATTVGTAAATRVANTVAFVAGDGSPDGLPPNPPANAVKIAKLRARRPAVTQSEIVKQTGISERTVSRYWAMTAPAVAVPKTNGHAVPNLISDGAPDDSQ